MEYGEELMSDFLRHLNWCLMLLFRPDLIEERKSVPYYISVIANKCEMSEYDVLVFLLKNIDPGISEEKIKQSFREYLFYSDVSQGVRHRVRDFSLESLME